MGAHIADGMASRVSASTMCLAHRPKRGAIIDEGRRLKAVRATASHVRPTASKPSPCALRLLLRDDSDSNGRSISKQHRTFF